MKSVKLNKSSKNVPGVKTRINPFSPCKKVLTFKMSTEVVSGMPTASPKPKESQSQCAQNRKKSPRKASPRPGKKAVSPTRAKPKPKKSRTRSAQDTRKSSLKPSSPPCTLKPSGDNLKAPENRNKIWQEQINGYLKKAQSECLSCRPRSVTFSKRSLNFGVEPRTCPMPKEGHTRGVECSKKSSLKASASPCTIKVGAKSEPKMGSFEKRKAALNKEKPYGVTFKEVEDLKKDRDVSKKDQNKRYLKKSQSEYLSRRPQNTPRPCSKRSLNIGKFEMFEKKPHGKNEELYSKNPGGRIKEKSQLKYSPNSTLTTNQNALSRDEYFMAVAILAGKRCMDKLSSGGACLVGPKGGQEILAIGYSGRTEGYPDNMPLSSSNVPVICHAEMNAILRSPSRVGGTLYVQAFPCVDCAKLIAQSGIEEVVYLHTPTEDRTAQRILGMAKVRLRRLCPKSQNLDINFSLKRWPIY